MAIEPCGHESLTFPLTLAAYYLVSALTAQAVKNRHDILIVDGAVRDNEGKIVGCTAFGRI